ncbi:hypothetical protein D9M73_222760 [compost metagenome]
MHACQAFRVVWRADKFEDLTLGHSLANLAQVFQVHISAIGAARVFDGQEYRVIRLALAIDIAHRGTASSQHCHGATSQHALANGACDLQHDCLEIFQIGWKARLAPGLCSGVKGYHW